MNRLRFVLGVAGVAVVIVVVIVAGLCLGYGITRWRRPDTPPRREASSADIVRVAERPTEPTREVEPKSVPGLTVSGKRARWSA